MRLNIRYFAQLADKAGCREEVIDMTGGSQETLIRHLNKLHPQLAPLLPYCRIAVNGEYATQGDDIPADAEVALIPPVSGG